MSIDNIQDNNSKENKVTFLGETHFRGQSKKFGIKAKDRTRHTYIIGKTGMGKSTMLENMAIQDIQNGEGLCFIDPHGSSAEKLLSYVPESRIQDVIYFNPSDLKFPMGLNVLEYTDEESRHLVSSGLMNTFKKIFADQFSGRMIYLLQNAILAILENKGESLLGINRIFTDKKYRKRILSNVKDPVVLNYWEDEFAKYTDKYIQEAVPSIQNKIGQFISNPLIRNIIGQKNTSFDIRDIMDKKKILICNLSLGMIGEDNVNLIGSLLVTKIYLAALSRSNLSYEELPKSAPFYLYVDEFQNFVNDSFAQILSQARKYNLALIVANQYIDQLDDNTKSAIFGNVGTMISFRVGASDAETLEKEFQPTFMAEDIVNLYRFEILLRMSIDGVPSAPFSALSMSPIEKKDRDLSLAVIALSRAVYGKSKDYIEQDIVSWYKGDRDIQKDKDDTKNTQSYQSPKAYSLNTAVANSTESSKSSETKDSNFNLYSKQILQPTQISQNNQTDNKTSNQTNSQIDRYEANRRDLQKIREKEIQKASKYNDPLYYDLIKDQDFDTKQDKKDETLSQLFIKASNKNNIKDKEFKKRDNYQNNNNRHNNKDLKKELKNNFVLRDAIAKAMVIDVDNLNTKNILQEDKKDNVKDVDKKLDNKEEIVEDKTNKSLLQNVESFDKENKELEQNIQNIKEDKKVDKEYYEDNKSQESKDDKDNQDKQDNLKINDIRKDFINSIPEDPDIVFIEKLLKGED